MSGRRRFLKTLVGGAAGLSLPYLLPRAAFAREAAAPLTLDRLSDTLAVIGGAGGNVIALSGSDGVLLVDTGSQDRARELMKTVASLPGGGHVPVAFNTHWHWDHSGGNEALRKAGARIIAHENTRLWMSEPIWVEWQNRTYPQRAKDSWPTETFWTTGQLSFGREPVEYGHLTQAHTDGDVYVYFRGQNVIAVGCVLAVGHYPILDYSTGGWIGGMAEATKKLLDLTDEKTRIVPGSGPVQTRADLAAEHEMLAALQEDLWQLMRKGYGPEDMLASHATQKFDAKWGNPDRFVRQTYRGLYNHVREMRGVV